MRKTFRKMVTEPPFEVDGKVFETVADLSRYSGINRATLDYRLKKGQTAETAVLTAVVEMVRESREVLGVIYPSLSAAAKAYDKDPESVRQRVYGGLKIHDALFLPNRRNKPIRVHGEDYPSRDAVAREFGIDKRTF